MKDQIRGEERKQRGNVIKEYDEKMVLELNMTTK